MLLRPARILALVIGALLAALLALSTASRSATAQVVDCGPGGLAQEAETGQLSGRMQLVDDPAASGGQAVAAQSGIPTHGGISDDVATYCVNIAIEGWYRIDGAVRGPTGSNDSFYVSIDDGAPVLWDFLQTSTWAIDSVSNRDGRDPHVWFLTTGGHTLNVYQREGGAALDRFEFVAVEPSCMAERAEAEDGFLSADMRLVPATGEEPSGIVAEASGNAFVQARPASPGRAARSDSLVELCLSIPPGAAGLYRLDATVYAATTTDNSFFVTVDDGPELTWHIPLQATWQVASVRGEGDVAPAQFDLAPGNHTVRFYQRESGTAIDSASLVLEVPDQAPYATHVVPGVVQAEDFDRGGSDVAYVDGDTGNLGGQYRPDEDVDIYNTIGSEGLTVGRTRGGEWLEYEVDVSAAGSYWFDVRAATGFANPGEIVITIDDELVGSIAVEPNGWWALGGRISSSALGIWRPVRPSCGSRLPVKVRSTTTVSGSTRSHRRRRHHRRRPRSRRHLPRPRRRRSRRRLRQPRRRGSRRHLPRPQLQPRHRRRNNGRFGRT